MKRIRHTSDLYAQFRRERQSRRVVSRLKRAEEFVKNRPVLFREDDPLWSPEAKWEAVGIINACRRACQFNTDVELDGTLAKYKR